MGTFKFMELRGLEGIKRTSRKRGLQEILGDVQGTEDYRKLRRHTGNRGTTGERGTAGNMEYYMEIRGGN